MLAVAMIVIIMITAMMISMMLMNDINDDFNELDIRNVHGDSAGLDDVDDDHDSYDDKGFAAIRFHGISKNYKKVCGQYHYTGKYRMAAHGFCSLKYKAPKETPMVFPNRSNNDYPLIIKLLMQEFEGQFECLGENKEKYITFLVPMEKQENGKTIKYIIRLINSIRFMARYLSSLTNNLAEGGKWKDCRTSLEYMTTKDGLSVFNCRL